MGIVSGKEGLNWPLWSLCGANLLELWEISQICGFGMAPLAFHSPWAVPGSGSARGRGSAEWSLPPAAAPGRTVTRLLLPEQLVLEQSCWFLGDTSIWCM